MRCYVPRGLPNIYSLSLHPSPLPLHLCPAVSSSPSLSPLYLSTPSVARSSAKLSGGGGEKQIVPPHHNMTMCRRKKTLLSISQASNLRMASRSSWLACQMIRLSGRGNYTLSRISDGMTITNSLSNAGVEASSKASDGWCGSQPPPNISFTPLSIVWTAIRQQNTSIPKCTLWAGGGGHRWGELLQDIDILIDIQSMLSVGDTLAPLIIMSNGINLSNFAGDKNEWPVHMTIGNLSSKIRQMRSTQSIMMVALLPIPNNNRNIPRKQSDEPQQTNREVLKAVPRRVLQPLTSKHDPTAESRYYNVPCADRNFRHCKSVLATCLADFPVFSDLNHLERHVCICCKCPKNQPGDYVPRDKQHPRWDRNQ